MLVDVQVHLSRRHEGLHEVVHELDFEVADALMANLQVVDHERSSAEIDGHADQRLVQRNFGVSEAHDALLRAERLVEGLADGQEVIVGPYRTLKNLHAGDPVKSDEKKADEGEDEGDEESGGVEVRVE